MSVVRIFHEMSYATEVFIGVITLGAIYLHLKYSQSIAHKGPAFLTTLGILGTFTGIAFGLLDFNTSDIQKSVPDLIDGIKTAFWASAWGILCALTIKVRDIASDGRKKISEKVSTGATINDLASLLKAVQQALVGNDDSTLIGQIRLARQDSNDRIDKLSRATEEAHQDTNDRLEALTRSLDEFGRTVAENNSRVLIDALKDVIREFNEKISEQFGENFKQLNQAVGQILVWQERYRQQMAEMIEQQQVTSQNMATATDRYQSIMERAAAFDAVARNMGALIEGLDAQRRQLDGSLSSLATLINTATRGFPEIEKKITEMVQQVGNGVRAVNDEFRAALLAAITQMSKQVGDNIAATNRELKTVLLTAANQTADSVKAAHDSVQLAGVGVKAASDGLKVVGEQMKASNDELKNVLLSAIQNSNREFNLHIDHMVHKMREQTVILDTALKNQLTTSLEGLGSQLAALSAKFATDYTPLTERLRGILEIAPRQ
jgi:ABC-type transporter Mla subunit MlaD